jgi:hypothetical protein
MEVLMKTRNAVLSLCLFAALLAAGCADWTPTSGSNFDSSYGIDEPNLPDSNSGD